MIDPKELRIGNWIYGLESQYEHVPRFFQVESLDEESINPHYPIDTEKWYAKNVTPIIITSDILYKIGFFFEQFSDHRPHYQYEDFHIDYDTLQPIDNGFEISKCEIKYLHQLQNLYFALTGEELKIEL